MNCYRNDLTLTTAVLQYTHYLYTAGTSLIPGEMFASELIDLMEIT